MESNGIVLSTNFKEMPLPKRGKVRDIYDLGNKLLIVSTDRISAYDYILPNGIPHKGRVLNELSKFWFEKTRDIVPNHLISTVVEDYPEVCFRHRNILEGRSMLVIKTKPIPVECVVRGYLSGSGWKEYEQNGSVCGIRLDSGLVESSRLEVPIFTPATKAEEGEHDENIPFEKMSEIVGVDLAKSLMGKSIAIYIRGTEIAEKKGIIIADTKFEFGIDEQSGEVLLIDEIMTPDSSRFWPKDEYKPGGPQKSFDKQFVRDYLNSIGWDRRPPVPTLPPDVIEKTSEKYLEALNRLTS
ncbi:MAG: phosphoribosylaminoimidazolesuccinocarboxamide synthase [Thermodesulfobacteriota bacterium]